MKKSVAIIGSGPSSLMLAAILDEKLFDVTLYEKNFAPARKFLVAGDGGFNLTHTEDIESFISRYTPKEFLEKSLRAFTNIDLRNWLRELGIETFVGTSKRVFPIKGIKPIDVLRVILKELQRKNVVIQSEHGWKGWNKKNELVFDNQGKEFSVCADIIVFALGGASWAKTGSDGSWKNLFEEKNINIVPFRASNCAYKINWDKKFLSQWEGKSLKNISVSCGTQEQKGESVVTAFGVEGGAIYALSSQIRKLLFVEKTAKVFIDLKPSLAVDQIKTKLLKKSGGSLTQLLKDELNLSGLHIALIKTLSTKDEFIDIDSLSKKIKKLPLIILGAAPIDEAISTVGGVSLEEVDETFQLKKLPHHYAIGEMLDWDAPTGGYLLQACFSMGNTLAKKLNSATH